ncbi:LexA family transcriptional regulator [Rhodopseudomonas sp. B29]|uniref:XRE family transcriptional regulator n=1 Tax=Rhodopseudomonas sp. B29 TaxID=95607 RepID=UPI0009FF7666|nr:LexA family transcriptional regulator [Rhodopseudomonas sp. B29]
MPASDNICYRNASTIVIETVDNCGYIFAGMEPGALIRQARERKNWSQKDLAERVGISQPAVRKIEGGSTAKSKHLPKIAQVLGLNLSHLDETLASHGGFYEDQAEFGYSAAGDANNQRPQNGILEIDVRAGMGGGGTVDGREVVHNGDYADPVKEEAWHFPARFLREEIRAPESRVQILETQGDSMSPTILSGDRVIIDTGHRLPSPDGIYAIRDQFGAIVVKRLQVLRRGDRPTIRIISDNKAHDSEDVDADEIHIVGRVLWGLKRL